MWGLQGSAMLLQGCWLAGGAYLAWRLSVGSIRRLGRMAGHNRKLKRELLNVWKGIQVRSEAYPVAQKCLAPASAAIIPGPSWPHKRSLIGSIALSGGAVWDCPRSWQAA